MKNRNPNATQNQLLAAVQSSHGATSPEQVIDVFLFALLDMYFLTLAFNNINNAAAFIFMANQAKAYDILGLDVIHPKRDDSASGQNRNSQWGLYELLPLNEDLFDSFQTAFSGLDPELQTRVYSPNPVFALKTLEMTDEVKGELALFYQRLLLKALQHFCAVAERATVTRDQLVYAVCNHDVLVNFAKLCCVRASDVRLDNRMCEILLSRERNLFDTPHGLRLKSNSPLEAYQYFIAARLVEKLKALYVDVDHWPPVLASFARRHTTAHTLDKTDLGFMFDFDRDCKFPCVITV